MMATYHPEEIILLNYATGAADEATALLVATHMALCPECRDTVAAFEDIGGAMLDDLEPEAVDAGSRATIMAALDRDEEEATARPMNVRQATTVRTHPAMLAPGMTAPPPLRDYLPDDVEKLPWRSLMRGLDTCDLPVGSPRHAQTKTRLLRVCGGQAMPAHTHVGEELILVLSGGFSDEHGHFLRGDVAHADEHVSHQPVADLGEDCVCLVVTTAPLKLTGRFARLANLFVRF